jgi:hypothetical protein
MLSANGRPTDAQVHVTKAFQIDPASREAHYEQRAFISSASSSPNPLLKPGWLWGRPGLAFRTGLSTFP